MPRKQTYWIRERHNPQLGVYYVAMGKMTKAEAKKFERAIYGHDVMLPYPSEEAYNEAVKKLGAQ